MTAAETQMHRDPNPSGASESRAELVQALAGLKYEADLVLSQKTRRAVRNAAIGMAERRSHQRRTIGFAVAAVLTLAVLLAPGIWNTVQAVNGGERFGDMPTEFMVLFMMLLPAVFAALFAVWKRQRDGHHDRSL